MTLEIPEDQDALISELIDDICACTFEDGLNTETLRAFIREGFYLVPKQVPEQSTSMSSVLSVQPDGTEWQPTDGLPFNKGPWW